VAALDGVFCRMDLVARIAQVNRNEVADEKVVVDNDDSGSTLVAQTCLLSG
jgi:hypothetical protein